MLRLPLCVALVLAAAPGALHAQARYPRAQPEPAPVVLSDRVKPQQPVAAAPAAPAPTLDINAVLPLDALAAPTRPEQEQILAQLIENTPDSDREEKSDYYFRLGTFYARQVRTWTAKASELGTAKASAAQQANVRQASDMAKTYLLKAVKVFKGLTDNDAFREYPKMDVALFLYGFTLQTGKYMKEARAVYDKLLKNYPNSQYVPYAHLVFGEYYFASGQLADAETRYKFVLKFPKSDAYWYAMYKLGWIHMQLQKPVEALESFAAVVFATRSDAKRKTMHDAAARDFVQAYGQGGKLDKAFEAFERIDKAAAPELVELLAESARQRGTQDAALTAYRQLLTRAPNHVRACYWQYRVAHSMLATPGTANAEKIRAIETLAAIYTRDHAADTDTECRDNTAAMTGELAVAFHAEWSKTRNPETLGYAEQLYAAHVTAFPSADAQRAAYAEVLWARADLERNPKAKRERWQRAAEVFGTMHTDGAPRAAALAALNALDFVAPTAAPTVATRAPARAPRATPLGASDAKLLAAMTAYLALDPPADAEVAQVRLAAATLLRRYKRFEDATTILDKFLAEHPDHASSELAALLLLDSMLQARSADLPDVVAAMASDLTFITGKPALLRELQQLRASARAR